jgi:uncharacterized Zn-finger protein
MDRKHERRFKCNICTSHRAFHLKTDLDRHTRTHQNSNTRQRFVCPEATCLRSYDRKDNLLRHVKRSHRSP